MQIMKASLLVYLLVVSFMLATALSDYSPSWNIIDAETTVLPNYSPSCGGVFDTGNHTVNFPVELHHDTPPKPLLIGAPAHVGEFPVILLLHGTDLDNSFYSQLIQHLASHGFIVVAPQLYKLALGFDCTGDIHSAEAITDWLAEGLAPNLPPGVTPNLHKLAIAGHSRGGKVAFAVAQKRPEYSVVIGIGPVGGTTPDILNKPFDLNIPALVIGSGYGSLGVFPCAPKGTGHTVFFEKCHHPASHFVATDYGHMDVLDDHTEGLKGWVSYWMCKNGKERRPMREFVGGLMVAFMRGYLDGEMEDLACIPDNPEAAPLAFTATSK